MIIDIENNPDNLKKGDLVVYIVRYRSGKKKLCIGEVTKGYGEGYEVKNLRTGELDKPYTQDTFLINEGARIRGVKVKLELTGDI